MIRYLVGLFAALLFSLPAHAVIPAESGYYYDIAGGTGSYSLAGTLNPWAAARGFVWTGCPNPWNNNTTTCTFTYNGNAVTPQTVTRTPSLICPANSTLSGSNCNCNSGFAELEGQCVATSAECPVGQGKTTNRTEGWARSPKIDANDIVSDLGPPTSVYGYNDGVCVGNITGVERCFRSAEPSPQGLYRVSCDYTLVVTGTATAAGESNSDPTEPVASCPGFVGEVNGKTVCVGTASSPLPAGTDAPNEPTSPGNPAAGPKPPTGPGSGAGGAGRTPTTGTGGNNGGPAGAATGTGGTGPRSDGTESTGEVCGASPLPPCNVKVDETGVPAEPVCTSVRPMRKQSLVPTTMPMTSRRKARMTACWTAASNRRMNPRQRVQNRPVLFNAPGHRHPRMHLGLLFRGPAWVRVKRRQPRLNAL